MSELIIPSSVEDRKKIKAALVEWTNSAFRIESEKENQKEIIARVKEEFGIAPKLAGKIAKSMYKNDYADLQAENEDFETLYDTLVNGLQEQANPAMPEQG